MAKFLHIETATKVCSVALSENGRLKDIIEMTDDKYIHSEQLTIFIEKICAKNEWDFTKLDAIVVTEGPGSYTGLRIGVSTAKGLCYALGLPLIAVNSIESIAAQAKIQYPNSVVCAAIDARRNEVFSSIYGIDGGVVKSLSADVLSVDSYAEFRPFVLCGDGAEKAFEIFADDTIVLEATILSSAKGQVQIAFKKFQAKDFEDVAYFEPFYLKDFVTTPPKKKLG